MVRIAPHRDIIIRLEPYKDVTLRLPVISTIPTTIRLILASPCFSRMADLMIGHLPARWASVPSSVLLFPPDWSAKQALILNFHAPVHNLNTDISL